MLNASVLGVLNSKRHGYVGIFSPEKVKIILKSDSTFTCLLFSIFDNNGRGCRIAVIVFP